MCIQISTSIHRCKQIIQEREAGEAGGAEFRKREAWGAESGMLRCHAYIFRTIPFRISGSEW